MNYISAVPAYGRDYKSQKEVKEAWEAGHAFLSVDVFTGSSGYINKDDLPNGTTINIRYNHLQKVLPIVSTRPADLDPPFKVVAGFVVNPDDSDPALFGQVLTPAEPSTWLIIVTAPAWIIFAVADKVRRMARA